MGINQLRARAKYWKRVLNLTEWKIDVSWMTEEDDELNAVGLCRWMAEEQTAEIRIRKTTPNEDVLLHEILHLLFDGHLNYEYEEYCPLHERSINKITESLMKLEYKGQ